MYKADTKAIMNAPESHKKLLHLLQDKERKNEAITQDEILSVTGWKLATLITYLSKDQLSDFLHEVGDKLYEASNSLQLTDIQFTQLLSQSKHRRGLGHNCKSRLAKALLKKSRENMLLALELYNRPSLENRLDSFVLCFCVAWEQLLKSLLIERDGENSIYKDKVKINGFRESISLRECLKKIYQPNDLLRLNIEKITFYRDYAAHLLMPEVQEIMSRVFQSGILNYSTQFQEFAEIPFISPSHSGILSLVGNSKSISNAILYSNYGKNAGDEIMSLIQSVTKDAEEFDDIKFAIPLGVKLVFAKSDDQGNTITLARAEDGIEGLRNAIILEKPTERHKTHPYKESDAINEINKRLKEQCSESYLEESLVWRNPKTKRAEINSYCFRAVVWKMKWKSSDNKFHYENKDPVYHYFSEAAVEEFISKIMSEKKYLEKARKDYSIYLRKKKIKT